MYGHFSWTHRFAPKWCPLAWGVGDVSLDQPDPIKSLHYDLTKAKDHKNMGISIDLNKVIRVFAFLTSLLCIVTGCIGIWRTSFSGYTIGGGDPSVTTTNRNAWYGFPTSLSPLGHEIFPERIKIH